MSFGFGPGDIVALITFSKKVYDALEEEEGSRVQYRRAVNQCDAFTTVINQVKRVDLSRFPNDFRQELEEIYTNAAEHITLFRKNTIGKYEKSLGKGTKRGMFASAPRKVQWAFGAAEDLEELRQSLGSWLSAIQTCITINMFERSMRNEGPFPAYYALPGPPIRSLTLPQLRQGPPLPRRPLYLDWAPRATQHREMERTVSLVSDLVYERLLSRPGLPIAEAPKVFTLGPADDAEATFLRGSNMNAQSKPHLPQQPPSDHGRRETSPSPPNEHHATTEPPGPNVVDSTNSYLHDMQLPPLTTSEAARLSGRDHDPQIQTPGIAPPDPSQERSHSPKAAESSRGPQIDPDTPPHPSSRDRGNPLAVPSLVGMVAKISYQLRVSRRGLAQPPYEVKTLFAKIREYQQLLQLVEATLRHSSSNHFFQSDGSTIACEFSVEVVQAIVNEVEGYLSFRRGSFRKVYSRVAWMARRRRIMAMVAEVDGLKMNLLMVLQIGQMEDDQSQLRTLASIVEALARNA